MAIISDFFDEAKALWLGGNPTRGATRPPAEVSDADINKIKDDSNKTVKGDTGIKEIDDGELAAGLMVNACNVYAAVRIRTVWTDKGGKIPQFMEEYQRLIKSIAEYEDTTQTVISQNRSIRSAYKSSGLNRDVEPHLDFLD